MGEALSYAFGAVPITAHCILRTNFLSLADEFAILRGGEQAPVAAASSVGAVAAAAIPGDAMEVTGAAEEAPPAAAISEDLVGVGYLEGARLTGQNCLVLFKRHAAYTCCNW